MYVDYADLLDYLGPARGYICDPFTTELFTGDDQRLWRVRTDGHAEHTPYTLDQVAAFTTRVVELAESRHSPITTLPLGVGVRLSAMLPPVVSTPRWFLRFEGAA